MTDKSELSSQLKDKLKNIKLLAMDFDGVMTDGHVFVNDTGEEFVRCSRKDGMGIEMLKRAGVEVVVISREENKSVSARCGKLKIACHQAVMRTEGKADILKRIAGEKNFSPNEIAFIGDDLNDIAALKFAATAITVADAHPRVRAIADYITNARGGKHAVREVCEFILTAKGMELEY